MFILRFCPKKFAHKQLFYIKYHRKLDFKNPKIFNEKMHWMMCNYYGKKEGNLADKYLAKEYIKSLQINGLCVPKNYYILNKIGDFHKEEYDKLPNKFVLKSNHGCGNIYVCNSKKVFDVETNLKDLFKQTKQNYVYANLEYHYSYIKPVVFFEELLCDGEHDVPNDYKFFCFNGYVDCVMVCSNRNKNKTIDFYDINWNHMNYSKESLWSKIGNKKPKNYDLMLKIASKISQGFPFIRVDLYNINGKIYFGELTFAPAAGLSGSYSDEGDEHLGSLLEIKNIYNKRNKGSLSNSVGEQ